MILTRGEKIADLMAEKGIKPKELINDIVNHYQIRFCKSTLNDLLNDKDKGYSYEVFVALADYFNVSTDYLLTDTQIRTTDKDLQFICDYSGLSEDTIKILHYVHGQSNFVKFIDYYIFETYKEYKKYKIYNKFDVVTVLGQGDNHFRRALKKIPKQPLDYSFANEDLTDCLKIMKEFLSDKELSDDKIDDVNLVKLQEKILSGNKHSLSSKFEYILEDFLINQTMTV